MIPYILYTALILFACLMFYKLLLQKETFYNLNRFVLLACMLVAFTLPLLPIPQQFSLQKQKVTTSIPAIKKTAVKESTAELKALSVNEVLVNETKQQFNMALVMQWIIYLYWFGVIVFALNFLMQAVILFYRAYTSEIIRDGKFRIVEITGDKAPCSFANNIFINPEKYEWETYNQILLHEKIHIEQKHTIDLLLAEIVLVFQWFNPFAWQWRKALESNLEFLTDNEMLQQGSVEKESYQFSLLKVAAPQFPLSLTTNYNQSLLKKRIIMMNSKKSNVNTTWKYFFLLPLLVLFACLFNQPAAQSQTLSYLKKEETKLQSNPQKGIETEGNWFATIDGNKVNMEFKNGEHSNSSFTLDISEFNGLSKDKQGTFSLTREAGTMNFTGKFEGNSGMGTYKFVANKNFTKEMAAQGVTLAEDTDLMVFFMVNIKTSYVKMLHKKGYKNVDKDELIPLSALNVSEDYINSIKDAGIGNVDIETLIPLKSLNIDKAFIEDIIKSGYKNVSPENLIALKSQNIDGKYINEYRSSTKTKRNENREDDEDNVIAFKSLNIDKAFIDSFKKAGYNDLSNEDLIALKSLNVTPEYVDQFEKAGYKNISSENLVALKSQNITTGLIKEYKDLGFSDLDLDDIVGAKAVGATPTFIKAMREKGHNFKDLGKYIALKAVVGN